jgi:hypothetical protein
VAGFWRGAVNKNFQTNYFIQLLLFAIEQQQPLYTIDKDPFPVKEL